MKSSFDDLPLEIVMQIDQLADEFEAQWQAGAAPTVDEYLAQFVDADPQARKALEVHLTELSRELTRKRPLASATPPVRGESTNVGKPANVLPLEIDTNDPPVVIGEYQLLDQLGAGGMGVVYRARHTKLDRLVALKFPRLGAAVDQRTIVRFLREARLVGKLNHPNIVQALDASESPYGPFLVTEFIEGETLGERIEREGPLHFDQALELAIQATDALQYAHQEGIIHRDIKPSNMLLDRQGRLRVVDFGLAKQYGEQPTAPDGSHVGDHTESGVFLGTVGYAAPEQLLADEGVDQRADIYSLGCVLFFMLTGKPPHKGTLRERVMAPQSEESGKIELPASDTSATFKKVWERITAADPTRRYDSMTLVRSALVTELFEWRQGHEIAPVRSTRKNLSLVATLLIAMGGILYWTRQSANTDRDLTSTPRAVAPFDAKEAQKHQQRWADSLGIPVRVENSLGMRFVLIPAGEFRMGVDDIVVPEDIPEGDWRYLEPDDVTSHHRPRHRVILTQPYYFGETEVTVTQFEKFVDATNFETDAERNGGWGKEDRGWLLRNGYSWKSQGQWVIKPRHPVMNITWDDATAFCDWLNKNDELGTYRLPTEAEWEFACRAGSETTYFFGDDPSLLADYAWFKGNFEIAYREVGLRKPNPFGIYDIYGNRQEWCLDAFVPGFYQNSPLSDPVCRTGGEERVLRGGTHTDQASFCTSARRWPQERNNVGAAGIRVICIPK